MTIQSLAIISKNANSSLAKQAEVLYIQSFQAEPKNSNMDDTDTDLENDLFGYNINDYLNKDSDTSDCSCSLKHEFLLHAALSEFDDRSSKGGNNAVYEGGAMFLGLICAVDDHRFYGAYCIDT